MLGRKGNEGEGSVISSEGLRLESAGDGRRGSEVDGGGIGPGTRVGGGGAFGSTGIR